MTVITSKEHLSLKWNGTLFPQKITALLVIVKMFKLNEMELMIFTPHPKKKKKKLFVHKRDGIASPWETHDSNSAMHCIYVWTLPEIVGVTDGAVGLSGPTKKLRPVSLMFFNPMRPASGDPDSDLAGHKCWKSGLHHGPTEPTQTWSVIESGWKPWRAVVSTKMESA